MLANVPFVCFMLAAAPARQFPAPPADAFRDTSRNVQVIISAPRSLVAGDSARLHVRTQTRQGAAVIPRRIVYTMYGGEFEATVDSTGMVHAGAAGTVQIAVVAIVPGEKPVFGRVTVTVLDRPAVRLLLSPSPVTLVQGQHLPAELRAVSPDGLVRNANAPDWRTSHPSVVTVATNGALQALSPGRSVVSVTAEGINAQMPVRVIPKSGLSSLRIVGIPEDARQGDATPIASRAVGGTGASLRDLAVQWSTNADICQVGRDRMLLFLAPGICTVTATAGPVATSVFVSVEPRAIRRRVELVGRLPRSAFSTEEVWVHPDGKHVYLGTGNGGDRLYAIDVRDPAHPVVTDSIVANTRRVNDIVVTADAKYLLFTREGASDRKDGIVIASLADPAHPVSLAAFTDGVTGGVHSIVLDDRQAYSRVAYLTNDGTGAIHVIDFSDPAHVRTLAKWTPSRTDAGRFVHDLYVKDGLLYAAYWNDGLIILDVGNGARGGSPSHPVLVSQLRYPLDSLYRDAALEGGPGFIRGTHTVWRHRNYVFIADEVFPGPSGHFNEDPKSIRAYGRLQVVDVANVSAPRIVAWYEPEFGGVHNVWIERDTLYLGAYNGGFHAFDISGELRGNLGAQGREIGAYDTGSPLGYAPGRTMTCGAIVNNGLIYVSDMYAGLVILKIAPLGAMP